MPASPAIRDEQSRSAVFIAEPGLVSSAVMGAWLDAGHRVTSIWTQDERALRKHGGQQLIALAGGLETLAQLARRHRIPIMQCGKLADTQETVEAISAGGTDMLFTLMTHVLVPRKVLERFAGAAINFHPALLPFYKGSRPILSMLADGVADLHGGITAHVITPVIDGGAIIAQRPVPRSGCHSLTAWYYALALAGADMMNTEIPRYLNGKLEPREQDMSAGNYRKSDRREFAVTADKTAAEIEALFLIAAGRTLRALVGEAGATRESIAVVRLVARLGAPTGMPPRFGAIYVEMDVADARIRLAKGSIWRRSIGHPAVQVLRHRLSH